MKWEESTNCQQCFSQNTWCCYGTFPLSRMEGFSVKEKFKTIIRDTTLFKTLSIKMKFQSLPLTRRCSWQRCHNSRWQGKVHHLVSPVLSTWQCFCFKHKITTDNLSHLNTLALLFLDTLSQKTPLNYLTRGYSKYYG